MRGKDLLDWKVFQSDRITPAHVGKSTSCYSCGYVSEDHPRTCGEKFISLVIKENALGSPPHMRGKGLNDIAAILYARITPAHAGKSKSFT